jgi:hypothetical protein
VTVEKITVPERNTVSESLRVRMACSSRDFSCTPLTAAATWKGLRWSAPNPIADALAFTEVVSWRDGYAAAAQVLEGSQRLGAVFTSPDGLQWRKTATFPAQPVLLTTTNGLSAFVNRAGPAPSVEAWSSRDGGSWQREEALTLAGSITHVISRGDVILALGADARGVPVLWRSVRNGAWAATPLPSARAILRSFAVSSDGFIAVGREGEPDSGSGGVRSPGVGRAAAWSSPDGLAWTAMQVEGGSAASAELTQVFRVEDGFLAMGANAASSGGTRAPLIWTSSDGRSWRLVGEPLRWGVASTNGHEVVVFTRLDFGTLALGAWATQDGASWSQLAFSGNITGIPGFETGIGQPSRVDRIVVAERGVLVVGQQNGRLATWFAEALTQ